MKNVKNYIMHHMSINDFVRDLVLVQELNVEQNASTIAQAKGV